METGNIVIESNSYVVHEYCLNTDVSGNCLERLQVVPYLSLQNQYLAQAEANSNVLVYGGIFLFFVWLIKGLFRLILPTKGRN